MLVDVGNRSPLVLFSTEGGMDIEEVAERKPDAIRRHVVDVGHGFGAAEAAALLEGMQLGAAADAVADVLVKIYRAFCEKDAELVEINPLAILRDGRVVALDCKFVLDDASIGAAARSGQGRLAGEDDGAGRARRRARA